VLLPHATVLTPNLREAEVLLDALIGTLREQHEAARALGALGAGTVVVKGGQAVTGIGSEAVDVVWDGRSVYELRGPRIDTADNHGTGCTFASATAAAPACGSDVPDALARAKSYVSRAIAGRAGWRLGRGHGPLDHFASPAGARAVGAAAESGRSVDRMDG
jgi:hydroxymethylpyrimidine/phosphomethylpyrimidine kinase